MRMALSAWVNQKRPENVTPDNGIIVPDFFIVASEFAWFMSTRNKKELREEVGKSSRRRGMRRRRRKRWRRKRRKDEPNVDMNGLSGSKWAYILEQR